MLGGNFTRPSSCRDGEDARVDASEGTAEVLLCRGGPIEEALRLLPGRTKFCPGIGVFESVSPDAPDPAVGVISSVSDCNVQSLPGTSAGTVVDAADGNEIRPLFSADAQMPQTS